MKLNDLIGILTSCFTAIGIIFSLCFSVINLYQLQKQKKYEYENNELKDLAKLTYLLHEHLYLVTSRISRLKLLVKSLENNKTNKEDVNNQITSINDDIDKLSSKLWSADLSIFINSQELSKSMKDFRSAFTNYIRTIERFLDYKYGFSMIIAGEIMRNIIEETTDEDISESYQMSIEKVKLLHSVLAQNLNIKKEKFRNKFNIAN